MSAMTPVSDTAPRSRYVDRDGLRLHHLDWGNEGSPPIVLVHGSRLHAHVWNDFGRRFRDRHHVIAVDQRGHGESGWGAEEKYQLEELYRDLRAVVEARGLKRYTLVGHSLGGRVSMLYAHRHQVELERLVLVDITPGRPPQQQPLTPTLSPSDGERAGLTSPSDGVRPALSSQSDAARASLPSAPRDFESEDAAIEYLGRAMSRAPRHLVEESVRRGMRRNGAGRYVWKYDPVLFTRRVALPPGMDLWNLMSAVATPTLLQYGSHSDVVNTELAERLRGTMPCCNVECIEDAGHGLFTDQPDKFAESVGRFIGAK